MAFSENEAERAIFLSLSGAILTECLPFSHKKGIKERWGRVKIGVTRLSFLLVEIPPDKNGKDKPVKRLTEEIIQGDFGRPP